MTGKQVVPRSAITTAAAPLPAGSDSQAVLAGDTLYVSGQSPRLPDRSRCTAEALPSQARLTLTNLDAIAEAASARLANDAFVTVYLRHPWSQAAAFDAIYRDVLDPTTIPPARAVMPSDLPHGEIEIPTMIPVQPRESEHDL